MPLVYFSFTLALAHFFTPKNMYRNNRTRRGAALVVALVLLAFLGIIASVALPQILRDRQEGRMELVREQTERLLDDVLRKSEAQRKSDPEFSGEILTLGPDCQPFPGTFLVTTKYQDGAFAAEVEYRNNKEKLLYTNHR